MDSNIMICICCTAESKVQRPWRMISTHALIDGVRVVKGAAVEASPSWTMGVSSMLSISPAHLAAPAAKAFPCFFCIVSCSFLISARNRPMTAFIAPIWPQTPVSSPRCLRSVSSSSTHCCCLDMRSRLLRASSSLAFLERACARSMASLRCSASACSASGMEVTDSSLLLPTLALPKPLRSASPTSASLRAPTSFPPSPHMRQKAFWLHFTAWITCSFCQGERRAKMRITWSWARMASACSPWSNISKHLPVTTRSRLSLNAAMPLESKATGGSLLLPAEIAGAHSKLPPSCFSERIRVLVELNCAMPTSCATLRAVNGASPVSITQLCLEVVKAWMTSVESLRVSHLKAMKPANVSPVSLASRGFWAYSRARCCSPAKCL
mmetsp:Transcript_102202/g.329509  ORF Transcript_102202/g.329509 Transcript_102202/m.329509 type:complete len:382 (+) Transcript_102202:1003-2148(+)